MKIQRPRKTPSDLRLILDYCPLEGTLKWKERAPESFTCAEIERGRISTRWNLLRSGRIAGHKGSHGYITLTIEGKTYPAHKVAWAVYYGSYPDGQIDHINHVKDDNRISNLRDVSPRENAKNKPLFKNNSSGIVGVYYRASTNRWRAKIWDGVKSIELGAFTSKYEAIAARQLAQQSLGFHKNHGSAS